MKQKRKGFTLIELLAIIFIIGIIVGIGSFFITNIIQNSKNRTQELTLANIKKTASIYVQENPNEITWVYSTDGIYSCVSIKNLINKGFLKEAVTENSDLTDDTYIIVTKNDSNTIISEELDQSKKCFSKLSCSIEFTGTKGNNGWYQTAGNVELKIENPNSEEIIQTGLSNHSTEEFNNLTSAEQINDTSGTTWYGYIQDGLGNIFSCQKEIKIDSIPPTCTSTGGETIWTKNNRTIKVECSDDNSGCSAVTKTFNTTTETANVTIKDGAGNTATCPINVYVDKTAPTCVSSGGSDDYAQSITLKGTCSDIHSGCVPSTASNRVYDESGNVYWTIDSDGIWTSLSPGTVYDQAGNSTVCPNDQTAKISTKPATPTITNPTNGNWVNYNFSLTVKTATDSSLIGYWQYSYDKSTWHTYSNSATNNFVTTPFSAERNQLVYIRVCTNNDICSDVASTMISIDKTAPTIQIRELCNFYLPTNGIINKRVLQIRIDDPMSGLYSGTYYFDIQSVPYFSATFYYNQYGYKAAIENIARQTTADGYYSMTIKDIAGNSTYYEALYSWRPNCETPLQSY